MQLAGSIEGQQVIDLACGEGHFTRLLKQKGVASILGVDASKGMIELALAEEDRRPLDIEYCVQDVCDLKANGKYDIAFAAWQSFPKPHQDLTIKYNNYKIGFSAMSWFQS